MKSISLLAVFLLTIISGRLCDPSQSDIIGYVNYCLAELSKLGCTYTLVQNTLNYNLNYDSTNQNIAIHFTGGFKDSNGVTYPGNVFANGTITSTSFPLYSIITRGDLFNNFGLVYPNANQYLVIENSNMEAFAAKFNLKLGFPFTCSGIYSWNKDTKLVNYINDSKPIGQNQVYSLAKIQDSFNNCHNILVLIDSVEVTVVGIRYFVSCNPNQAPFI